LEAIALDAFFYLKGFDFSHFLACPWTAVGEFFKISALVSL
jgi:hypothetical protein